MRPRRGQNEAEDAGRQYDNDVHKENNPLDIDDGIFLVNILADDVGGPYSY
jgi:hypothetical protein